MMGEFVGSWPLMSLPSRERGLKYCVLPAGDDQRPSLPSRERGLKWHAHGVRAGQAMSLPSRERGLKFWPGVGVGTQPRRSLHGSVD